MSTFPWGQPSSKWKGNLCLLNSTNQMATWLNVAVLGWRFGEGGGWLATWGKRLASATECEVLSIRELGDQTWHMLSRMFPKVIFFFVQKRLTAKHWKKKKAIVDSDSTVCRWLEVLLFVTRSREGSWDGYWASLCIYQHSNNDIGVQEEAKHP